MKNRTLIMLLFFVGTFVFTSCSEESEEMEEVAAEVDDMSDDMMEEDVEDGEDNDTTEENDEDGDEDVDNESEGDAPGFTLTSVNGREVSLSDFKGKPVVIFFFGNTCSSCIGSGPTVESKINRAFTSSQIAIVGIDTWNGNKASVENFKSSTGITFDLLLEGKDVQSDYSTTYDRLFLIDANGDFVHKGGRAAGSDAETVADLITAML